MVAWSDRIAFICVWVVMLSVAVPAVAQPGSGMNTGGAVGTNPVTGGVDTIGANALNMQFNVMALMLQQQTFLMSAALADPKVQQAIAEEQRKAEERLRLYAQRGHEVIVRGRATTTFVPVADAHRHERIASAFGPDAAQRGLVPKNLQVYESLARQRNLRLTDVADLVAIAVAVCYQTGSNLPKWDIGPGALDDLRKVTHRRLLDDAEFQGMPDSERQTLHEFLSVWVVALVADYAQALQITFTKSALQRVQDRAKRAVPALVGADIDRLRFTDRSFSIEPPPLPRP